MGLHALYFFAYIFIAIIADDIDGGVVKHGIIVDLLADISQI